MDLLKAFWKEQAEWSRATFGDDQVRGPRGPLLHLQKEVYEALDAFEHGRTEDFHEELVDCLFLVFDSSRRAGLTYEMLAGKAFQKIEKNKKRKWNPPTSDVPVEHIRD